MGNLFYQVSSFESNSPIFHLPIVQSSPWSLPWKDAYDDIASPKSFVHRRWKKSWLVCHREEGDPNDVYTVTVKTNGTKTVQIKLNNDLLSFQLRLIIDFVLTERKLAHGPITFPARSIGHFAMNIIIVETGSTAKVNSAK